MAQGKRLSAFKPIKRRENGRLAASATHLMITRQLRTIMREDGITIADLARNINCSRSYLGGVFSGANSASIHALEALAAAAGCVIEPIVRRSE